MTKNFLNKLFWEILTQLVAKIPIYSEIHPTALVTSKLWIGLIKKKIQWTYTQVLMKIKVEKEALKLDGRIQPNWCQKFTESTVVLIMSLPQKH